MDSTMETQRKLLMAALRVLKTQLDEIYAHSGDESAYAEELLAVAAREHVLATQSLPEEEQPIGWNIHHGNVRTESLRRPDKCACCGGSATNDNESSHAPECAMNLVFELAAMLKIMINDLHPNYENTSRRGRGIGDQMVTRQCNAIDPEGAEIDMIEIIEWTVAELFDKARREGVDMAKIIGDLKDRTGRRSIS